MPASPRTIKPWPCNSMPCRRRAARSSTRTGMGTPGARRIACEPVEKWSVWVGLRTGLPSCGPRKSDLTTTSKVYDLCGRPFGSKRNLRERFGTWSGADMCAASAAARFMPRAQMGVRRSGPIQAHALEALVAKLVVLIRSLDRAPSLSSDPPTPRQPRGRDGAYTAATGAR